MKRIQTKFILIFLGIVVLPLFPIVWLVNGLVQQSYEIGVNPRVEKALSDGVDFSRQLYQSRKIQLAEHLSVILEQVSPATLLNNPENEDTLFVLPADNSDWHFLALQIYDQQENIRLQILRETDPAVIMNSSHFSRLSETSGDKIVIANREQNQFIALEKKIVDQQVWYFTLIGAMAGDFLANSNHALSVRQVYRTMELNLETILSGFRNAFLAFALIILVTVVAIAIWLSRRLTRPLAALADGTRELGQGNLDYRIEQQSTDEVGELVQQFNRMGDALKTFQERTIYLEKMAAWQEIARRLAHEIKNPLTPIQLTIQEMVDQYDGNDVEYQQLLTECHGIVSEEIENLRKLVREFSDFGRLPALQMEKGDINTVITDISGLYPHQELVMSLDTTMPSFPFDEDRIRRVLINLIGNAIQADETEQPIHITSNLDGEMAKVSVKDQGKGMSAEVMEKVFQPYFSTKNNGIGLGLAITRKMVEEHNGNITVKSAPGKGSEFIFWLATKQPLENASVNVTLEAKQ